MFRFFALAVLAGTVAVSGYHRHRARARSEVIPRGREALPLMIGRAVVGLPLFGGVAAYIVAPSWMDWASFEVPVWLRWFGVALGLSTMPAVHWTLRTLGRNVSETVFTKAQHELVTQGPYRWIRHPLYTTGILLFVALGLIAANWFVLLCALIALVSIRLVVVPLEERELVARFGSKYERYMRHVGAMVPLGREPHTTEDNR